MAAGLHKSQTTPTSPTKTTVVTAAVPTATATSTTTQQQQQRQVQRQVLPSIPSSEPNDRVKVVDGQPQQQQPSSSSSCPAPAADVVIAGAGIVGLTLAVALHEHCNITAELYDKATEFKEDYGGGMGLYPNGLRVLRDIDRQLLTDIVAAGVPYGVRRWERHDGTTVAVAQERVLTTTRTTSNGKKKKKKNKKDKNAGETTAEDVVAAAAAEEDPDAELLQSVGIRRWRLQKELHDAAVKRGIPIHFKKNTVHVREVPVAPATTAATAADDDDDDDRDAKDGNTNRRNNSDHGKNMIELTFEDGSTRTTRICFVADGAGSRIREGLVTEEYCRQKQQQKQQKEDNKKNSNKNNKKSSNSVDDEEGPSRLRYTGTTCLLGMAPVAAKEPGICFPSSLATNCHAVLFPTAAAEQCFQFHVPIANGAAGRQSWCSMDAAAAERQCRDLAEQLHDMKWHEKYLEPLRAASSVVAIGFATLQPRLRRWVFGPATQGIVLLGDAAHPPVPYLGQGAQMGMEDAGTIALLLKHLCCSSNCSTTSSSYEQQQQQQCRSPCPQHSSSSSSSSSSEEDDADADADGGETKSCCRRPSSSFDVRNFRAAMKLYQELRIPRTADIIDHSLRFGRTQQKRADRERYNVVREEMIRRSVFFHETLPVLFPGATHDYAAAVREKLSGIMPSLYEEDDEEEEDDDDDEEEEAAAAAVSSEQQ